MINILKLFKTNVEKSWSKKSGDSSYLPGEIIDRIKFEDIMKNLKRWKKNLLNGERVINGYY